MYRDSQGQIYLLVAQSEHGSLLAQHRYQRNRSLARDSFSAGHQAGTLRSRRFLDDSAVLFIGWFGIWAGSRDYRTDYQDHLYTALHSYLRPNQSGHQRCLAAVCGVVISADRFADIQHPVDIVEMRRGRIAVNNQAVLLQIAQPTRHRQL